MAVLKALGPSRRSDRVEVSLWAWRVLAAELQASPGLPALTKTPPELNKGHVN